MVVTEYGVNYDYIEDTIFNNNYENLEKFLVSKDIIINVIFKNLIQSMLNNFYYLIAVSINKEALINYIEEKKRKGTLGGANKYKKTGNKASVIYKKKEYTRVIYICDRKKYIKINKNFILLSKLKNV